MIENSLQNSVNSAQTEQENKDAFKSLRKTTLIFFVAIGSLHLLTGLMAGEGQLLPISNMINKVLDIPFAILAGLFGLLNFKISENSPVKRVYMIISAILLLLILVVMLYFTILLPDKLS